MRRYLIVVTLIGLLSACTVTVYQPLDVVSTPPAPSSMHVLPPTGSGFAACSHGAGIGLTATDELVVVGLRRNGPAWIAGIEIGDRIVAIDGVRVWTLEDATRRALGVPGTLVEVEVRRPGTPYYLRYLMLRDCL
jgi:C-terminal processing protease CtpA/Prc